MPILKLWPKVRRHEGGLCRMHNFLFQKLKASFYSWNTENVGQIWSRSYHIWNTLYWKHSAFQNHSVLCQYFGSQFNSGRSPQIWKNGMIFFFNHKMWKDSPQCLCENVNKSFDFAWEASCTKSRQFILSPFEYLSSLDINMRQIFTLLNSCRLLTLICVTILPRAPLTIYLLRWNMSWLASRLVRTSAWIP